MKTKNGLMLVLFLQIVMLPNLAFAQLSNELNWSIRSETIKQLSIMVNDLYVNPDIATKMSNQLIVNLQKGKYDSIDDFNQLGRVLTDDLFQIAHDRHLRTYYSPSRVAMIKKAHAEKGEDWIKDLLEDGRPVNYWFQNVKILPGNIGYLRLNRMERLDLAGETAISAMNFLSNSDFVIFDLRNITGGWPSTIQFLASYFYKETDNIILFEKHYRKDNEIVKYRSLPYLPGKRMDKVPLYILISSETFSAGEIFTYSLQKLGRAVVVGEKSNFGAHGTEGPRILNDYYVVDMPILKNISPVTKTSYEGIGVEPDIKTESKDALDKTIEIIFDKLIEENNDERFINGLGYSLLEDDQFPSAINVFIKNTILYPQSANTFDSLAEAYMIAGNKEQAIKNYEKSLELNPQNTNAVEQLKKLGVE
ncbi:MAG: tetratricopeptide repeat protein [Bacteroidetes bacterium]|nr:tetratricopeptide repeat protein [Bacteroidota bacterium]